MNYLLEGQTTERLTFRKLSPADFPSWLKFFQHPLSTADWDSDGGDPLTWCTQWFEKQRWRYQHNLGGMNALIHRETHAFIGQCGLLLQTVDGKEELEIGYSIMPEYWNQGYATEAAEKCRDFVRENDLRDSLISIINVRNTRSEKVATHIGMTREKTTVYDGNTVNIFRLHLSLT